MMGFTSLNPSYGLATDLLRTCSRSPSNGVSDCSQGYGIEDERHSQHAANRPAQEPNRLPLVHVDRSPVLPAKQNGSRGKRFRRIAVLFAGRFHGETDLEGDLIVLGFTAFDMARRANHLEPAQIAQRAVSAVEPGIDRSLDAVGG